MDFQEYIPFWKQLTPQQQQTLQCSLLKKTVLKGTTVHSGFEDCAGLLLPISGQLRVYISSEEGKEITLYRLFERDMCLFSASCMLKNILFDVIIQAEQDTTLLHIPVEIYKQLMEESLAVSHYTNELMAYRFSDVMWLIDQILNKKLDTRLAAFLIEESRLIHSNNISVTHEQIAHHLGTAREVVTRMLKYFQTEGLVLLTRGNIQLVDAKRLKKLAFVSLK